MNMQPPENAASDNTGPCHLCVTSTREDADAMLGKMWTLVCSAEDRAYTAIELEELIATCTSALAKLRDVSEESVRNAETPIETRRPNKVDKHRIDHGDYVRASGDVTCKVCGHVYYDHPAVMGYEWLRRACDGKLLKL